MTPNEITTLIASNLGKELDVPFKLMMFERVKYWRATLVKQSLDRKPSDRNFFRQTIYLPMERVKVIPTNLGINQWVSQTSVPVPIPIRVSEYLFDYVGGPDGNSPWGYADTGTREFLKGGKYGKHLIYHEYRNNRIFADQDLDFVQISGIFNSPEEAAQYATVPPQPDIDWWDLDFPTSGDVEQRIVQCILATDYQKTDNKDKTDDYEVQVNNENH